MYNERKNNLSILNGVEALVISKPDSLVHVLQNGAIEDIDVLLPKNVKLSEMASRCRAYGFNYDIKYNSPDQLLAYRYHSTTGLLSMVDLYADFLVASEYGFWSLRPEVTEEFWNQSHDLCSGIKCLAPVHRLCKIAISILVKGISYTRYRTEVAELESEFPSFRGFLHRYGMESESIDKVIVSLSSYDRGSDALRQIFVSSLMVRRSKAQATLRWVSELLKIRVRTPPKRLPIVAIVGLDGSGKSTLIRDANAFLSIKRRTLYWGSRTMILPTTRLQRWIERTAWKRDIRVEQRDEEKYRPEDGVRDRDSVFEWLRAPILLGLVINQYLEYIAKYLVCRIYQIRGGPVFADRYAYDEFLEYRAPLYKVRRYIYRLLFPRPDLLVLVSVSAERVQCRKPSISSRIAAQHNRVYRAILQWHRHNGGRGIELQGDDDVVENRRKLLEIIFG